MWRAFQEEGPEFFSDHLPQKGDLDFGPFAQQPQFRLPQQVDHASQRHHQQFHQQFQFSSPDAGCLGRAKAQLQTVAAGNHAAGNLLEGMSSEAKLALQYAGQASREMDATLDRLERDFHHQRELMVHVRAIAMEFRPIHRQGVEMITKVKAFAGTAHKSYLNMFEKLIAQGNVDGAKRMLQSSLSHLQLVRSAMEELKERYRDISRKSDMVAAQARHHAHDALMQRERAQQKQKAGVTMALGGAGVQVGGAATLVLAGAGPLGWAMLLGGAAGGVAGFGGYLQGAHDESNMALSQKHALAVGDTLARINQLLQQHTDELGRIQSSVEAVEGSSTVVLNMCDIDVPLVLEAAEAAREDFRSLEAECITFLETDFRARQQMFRRLGLEG